MRDIAALGRIRFVLSHPVHAGNIGASARALKTMGLARLTLVAPAAFPHADARARARGAADVLDRAIVCGSLEEALAGTVAAVGLTARRRDLAAPMRTAREAAAEIVAASGVGETAIVLGNETCGLSNEELALCRFPATIPADPACSSLNLAAAVQVMAYELRLAALGERSACAADEAGVPSSFEEVEGLLREFERSMVDTGFLDPGNPRRLMLRLRRLFARAHLEQQEVNILRGVIAAWRAKVDQNTGNL